MNKLGLHIYFLFTISWFLHLPARLPVLGAMRFDLMLMVILAALAFSVRVSSDESGNKIDKWLRILIAYAILVVPFTEWPGSVFKLNVPEFIKAVVFYYFTVSFVRTEQDLKKFVYVFVGCQLFRVVEPLYLHLTEGYWGSQASMMGGTEFLNRLSGSPYDIVNPNGLAFVISTVIPFVYFLGSQSWRMRLVFIIFIPLCLYALVLTGSRSGIVAMAAVFAATVWKSKYSLTIAVAGVIAAIVGFTMLPADMQDRYLSITSSSQKNNATADERLEGLQETLRVGLRRPLFGHGLGTSAEANANFATSGPYAFRALPAHDLYLELFVELGLVGLIIFLIFMKSIIVGFMQCRRLYGGEGGGHPFLPNVLHAMQVWVIMNIVFSFASYGLSLYTWYLFAGFSVILQRLSKEYTTPVPVETDANGKPLSPRAAARRRRLNTTVQAPD